MSKAHHLALLALALLLFRGEAHAIRPFVTDDARVVGESLAQVETWAVFDKDEAVQHALFAIGPTDWLEVTTGLTQHYLYGDDGGYGITGGLLQAKALLREPESNGWPGVALVAGVIPPLGSSSIRPAGVSTFGFAILTQSFFEDDLLIHANIGTAAINEKRNWDQTMTAGLGFQAKVIGGFHVIGEIYRGDPYDPTLKDKAVQVGFRHIFSDIIQIDGTVGKTIDNPILPWTWMSLGIRLVTPNKLW